ncbi:MAG: hypothetical protein IJ532_00390, partial [Alphaproteobacteria bacterium]|nr:hypothetical protein [Alphaproteobacteria bacterium]
MKYSRSALGLLKSQYRSVLKKCLMINLGLFALMAPVRAEDVISTVSDFSSVGVGDTIGTVDLSSYATATDLATTNGKVTANETAISDINTTLSGYGDIVTHDANEFATATDLATTNGKVTANETAISGINTTLSGYGDIVTHDANEFATATDLA